MEGLEIDFTLRHPFTCFISGPTKSGKSTLTRQIILRHEEIIDAPIKKIVYCYGVDQPVYFAKLKQECPKLSFHYGIPEDFGDELGTPMLYILDDLMSEGCRSKDVLNAFVRESHHKNISVIFLTQCFFHPGLRPISLNSHYFVIFKNPRETQVIRHLGQQMNCGRKCNVMEEAFRDAVSKPYRYLFIDCTQEMDDRCRLRNDLFGDEGCKIYIKK